MQINRLAATFGRLEHDTLELAPGLNVIEAPNEAGKSTWTAFLRVMLYGLNTRDRSPGADKRRYLPWSGSAMEGRLELTHPRGNITILRRTARANSPMGSFSAVYTGTAEAVDWLAAADCGEILLGVPQEVFERSAYIRQTGLAVEQSKALEQRITSLITTGEEDTSFSAAAEILRRQLNARRYNKSGLIPQTEQEIRDLQAVLADLDVLARSAAQDQRELEAIQLQVQEVDKLLARHDAADQADILRGVESARLDVASAHDKVKTLESGARSLPTRQELETLQGRIDTLSSINWSVAEAKSRLDYASRQLREAEEALESHPCAGMTPAEAAEVPVNAGPRPRMPRWVIPVIVLVSLALGGTVAFFTRLWMVAAGGALGLFGAAMVIASSLLRKKQRAWATKHAELIRRRDEDAEEYRPLYEAAENAKAAYLNAQGAWEAVSLSARTNLDIILNQLRAFRPMVRDLEEACRALDLAFEMRGELDLAISQEEELRHRWEALRDAAPPIPTEPAQRPELTREQLRLRRSELLEADGEVRRRMHATLGRMQGLGDPQELSTQLQGLEEKRTRLQREYDAAAMAAEALFTANASLQTRFSPALGEHAADIFTNLTGGKYNRVTLDRTMRPSVQEAGEIMSREGAQLSQGTIDQLYLAVRLAICDMVLPGENAIPILLDDALVNFDDQRMAAALDYFLEAAQRRQILLFTCQRREGDYLNWAYSGRFRHIRL
ncbi:MAG: AAA family ATPase [Oscillospiraceae bacterium]|nr:AAA family ATPase [Oscillospiraceae bacterium]